MVHISNEKLRDFIDKFQVKGINKKSLKKWTAAATILLLVSTLSVSQIGCIKGAVIEGITPDFTTATSTTTSTGDNSTQTTTVTNTQTTTETTTTN